MAIEEKDEQTTSLKDLIELVEKDPIPNNEFTIEDKDPLVILGKLNEVIAYLKTLQATINSSDTKANQALENAIKALSSASESLQASTTALNSSNLALETANLAIDTANTSLEGSNQAKTASNEAIDKANNALQIAQEALNRVIGSLGSKVYDNNGNLKSNVKFAGHNGINVDLAEDNETFDIRLDEDITKAIEDNHTAIEQTKAQAQANKEDIANLSEMVADNEESTAILQDRVTNAEENLTEINPKIARALLTPMTAPSGLEFVGIDTNNAQKMLKFGLGFALENGDTIIPSSDITRNDASNLTINNIKQWRTKLGIGDWVSSEAHLLLSEAYAGDTTTIDLSEHFSMFEGEEFEAHISISGYSTDEYIVHVWSDVLPMSVVDTSNKRHRALWGGAHSRQSANMFTIPVKRYLYVYSGTGRVVNDLYVTLNGFRRIK